MNLKTVVLLTFHLTDEERPIGISGVQVERDGIGSVEIPLIGRGFLYSGESITIENEGGVLKVTKRAELDD